MTHHTHDKEEPTEGHSKDIAGKGKLDDEVLPRKGDPVEQEGTGGDEPPKQGKGDDMAPEAANVVGGKLDEEKNKRQQG